MEIIKDGTVNIDTIFRFATGMNDMNFVKKVDAFLWEAKENNCTVRFLNEDITIPPKGMSENDIMKISIFGCLLCNNLFETARRGLERCYLRYTTETN